MKKETKVERFKRLSELRVKLAVKRIGILENFKNGYLYCYTKEDVIEIERGLSSELKRVVKMLNENLCQYQRNKKK